MSDAYHAEQRVRFEPRPDDLLAVPPDLAVSATGCGVELASGAAAATVSICGLSPEAARGLASALAGGATPAELATLPGVTGGDVARLLEHAFGRVLFAPPAVAALERQVPGVEIVRYPGSPYEIAREYWEHQGLLAGALREQPAPPPGQTLPWLRRLHGLVIAGDGRGRRYRPASPIAARTPPEPGALLEEPTRLSREDGRVLIVSGPRVGAGQLGGPRIAAAQAALAGDDGYLAPARAHRDSAGTPWGEVVTARAPGEAADARWFVPPRPITPSHLAAVEGALAELASAAEARRAEDTVGAGARVHRLLVRLHPFVAANQSLAFGIVNAALRRARGAGIPHLVLDHLALAGSDELHLAAFRAAVDAWGAPGESAAARTLRLAQLRAAVFALLGAVDGAHSPAEARARVLERPGVARAALLA